MAKRVGTPRRRRRTKAAKQHELEMLCIDERIAVASFYYRGDDLEDGLLAVESFCRPR